MAASCNDINDEAQDTRLKNAFQTSFDKLRAELQLETKLFNSILYSKRLISGEVRMKNDIDITLSAINLRLENVTIAKSTFWGFVEAVSQIHSKMHLKTMLECLANDSTDRDITAAGDHSVSGAGTASSKQARRGNLETSRESAMSAITGSVENLRSVSWRQVIDQENSHSHSADHHSESGNMPNVSVEYVRELKERVLELENSIKQLNKEKYCGRELMLDKISDVSKANSQLEEAFNMLQLKEDEADDLLQTLHLLKKRIKTLEATIKAMEAQNLKQALYEEAREKAHKDKTRLTEEKIFQAEEKARQAEKKTSQAVERATWAEEKARQAAGRAFQAEKQLFAWELNEDDQDFEEHGQAEEEWEEYEARQQAEEDWEEDEARQQAEEEEARRQDEEEWEEDARRQDEEEWDEEEAHRQDEEEWEARQQDEEEWEARRQDEEEWDKEARRQDEEEWEARRQEWEACRQDEEEWEAHRQDEEEWEARWQDEEEWEADEEECEEEEARRQDEEEWEARQQDEEERDARWQDEEEWDEEEARRQDEEEWEARRQDEEEWEACWQEED